MSSRRTLTWMSDRSPRCTQAWRYLVVGSVVVDLNGLVFLTESAGLDYLVAGVATFA